MKSKVCPKCGLRKPVAKFSRNVNTKDGLAYQCKDCHTAYVKAHREANADYYRQVQLRCKYGITVEIYNKMLEAQGGVCAICGNRCPTGKALAVDHDKETGQVRGLLCSPCNTGIGQLQHSVDLLTSAMSYLVRSQNETAVANV